MSHEPQECPDCGLDRTLVVCPHCGCPLSRAEEGLGACRTCESFFDEPEIVPNGACCEEGGW